MRLSTRGRYASRALIDLAMHQIDEPVLLKDIAKRQQISLPYLEHLITPLIAKGIIRTLKGPKGGVCLSKAPKDIKLSEVIELFEGSSAPVACVDNPEICPRYKICVMRDIWIEISQAVNGILESTTLQHLIERQKSKEQQGAV